MKGKAWKAAYYYSGGHFGKLRVELPDSSIVPNLYSPVEIDEPMDEIWDMRGLFPQKWYALKMTVTPGGKCTMDFSYDENDASFFDS